VSGTLEGAGCVQTATEQGGHPVSPGHYETKWENHKISFQTRTTLDHLHLVHPRLSVISKYGSRDHPFLVILRFRNGYVKGYNRISINSYTNAPLLVFY
jgi:hypothetical protein